MNRLILLVLFTLNGLTIFAQNEHHLVRKGNKLYDKDNYSDAEAKYKKALEIDPKHPEAGFNLGDAYFLQKRYEEAITQFTIAANATDDPLRKNMAYHNLGNANLEAFKAEKDPQKKSQYLDKSIEAYKNALKINPNDQDTKYNLSCALKYKENQQGGQNKQDQDQQKNQENKDKKDQDQQKKEDQNKQDDKQQQNKEEQQQQPQQQMTKKEAENLLDRQRQDEKKVQAKVMQQKTKSTRIKIEKEW